MNSFQILSFYQEFIQFSRKMKEFVENLFKNEKNCKNPFNFKQKWTNIVFIKSSSQNSIFEEKKHIK